MKRIPKSFKVLGHTIKVIILPASEWKAPDCVGFFDPQHSRIVIRRARPASLMHHTFWHEVVHVVLNVINHRLYTDESFVDNMGGVLAQIAETAHFRASPKVMCGTKPPTTTCNHSRRAVKARRRP